MKLAILISLILSSHLLCIAGWNFVPFNDPIMRPYYIFSSGEDIKLMGVDFTDHNKVSQYDFGLNGIEPELDFAFDWRLTYQKYDSNGDRYFVLSDSVIYINETNSQPTTLLVGDEYDTENNNAERLYLSIALGNGDDVYLLNSLRYYKSKTITSTGATKYVIDSAITEIALFRNGNIIDKKYLPTGLLAFPDNLLFYNDKLWVIDQKMGLSSFSFDDIEGIQHIQPLLSNPLFDPRIDILKHTYGKDGYIYTVKEFVTNNPNIRNAALIWYNINTGELKHTAIPEFKIHNRDDGELYEAESRDFYSITSNNGKIIILMDKGFSVFNPETEEIFTYSLDEILRDIISENLHSSNFMSSGMAIHEGRLYIPTSYGVLIDDVENYTTIAERNYKIDHFLVYPNVIEANESVTVESPKGLNIQNLKMIDISGKLIEVTFSVDNGNIAIINVPRATKGLYALVIETDEGTFLSEIIIK
jgi:hypothetical protein